MESQGTQNLDDSPSEKPKVEVPNKFKKYRDGQSPEARAMRLKKDRERKAKKKVKDIRNNKMCWTSSVMPKFYAFQ